jgi:hypothetical protein
MKAFVDANRTETTPFDSVVVRATPDDDRASIAAMQQWANAGATWLIEDLSPTFDLDKTLTRIKQGPPRCE